MEAVHFVLKLLSENEFHMNTKQLAVKLSLCLVKHRAMKTYGGVEV